MKDPLVLGVAALAAVAAVIAVLPVVTWLFLVAFVSNDGCAKVFWVEGCVPR